MLPIVVRVYDWQGQTNTLLTTPATLTAPVDNATLRVKKGVGTASPVVTASDSFVLDVEGPFSSSSGRTVQVLDDTYPVRTYAGPLAGDVVWDASQERHITDDLLIPRGSTLTIEAGTRVLLGDKRNLRVEGDIVTRGTADEPVVFNSLQRARPWGGIELIEARGRFEYTFFTNGGADTTKTFGHSQSQPVVMADASTLDCENCFVLNSVGKAFGSRSDARVTLDQSVISHADTGGEFQNSIVHVTQSHIKDIPNDDGIFVDDDNDGFYFRGVHSSGQPSRLEDSLIITTKDDGLDHNGARLQLVRAWIEGAAHEGVAASNSNWVTIEDSVLLHNNQGVEAGYGSPEVSVRNSVIVSNDNRSDPGTPITAGIRFGDGYDGRLGAYLGHIAATGNVLHDNGDNVRNFDGSIPGPQPGAIDITYSLTNDPDFDASTGNTVGDPLLGPFMHSLRGSAGSSAGENGITMGRLLPATSVSFTINALPGDANRDGRFNSRDIVALLQSAKFNTNLPATWEEGDFDGNGLFDAKDLVLALATGNYEQEALAAIPPASYAPSRVARSLGALDDDLFEVAAAEVALFEPWRRH